MMSEVHHLLSVDISHDEKLCCGRLLLLTELNETTKEKDAPVTFIAYRVKITKLTVKYFIE